MQRISVTTLTLLFTLLRGFSFDTRLADIRIGASLDFLLTNPVSHTDWTKGNSRSPWMFYSAQHWIRLADHPCFHWLEGLLGTLADSSWRQNRPHLRPRHLRRRSHT